MEKQTDWSSRISRPTGAEEKTVRQLYEKQIDWS
jgi:hypothetical protein